MIFGPMLQVGCASASSAVTSCELVARLRPRNGPPDAVSTSESTGLRRAALEALEERRSARCRPGSSRPPPRSLRRERELAGGDEALLVRERERDAALERPERRARRRRSRRSRSGRRPARRRSSSAVTSPPTCTCSTPCARASSSRSAASRTRAAQSSSSGLRSTTSIACRPIEPVAPSRAYPLHGQQCAAGHARRRGPRRRPPGRRRAASRSGRARRRGRRAAGPCPSPAGRA